MRWFRPFLDDDFTGADSLPDQSVAALSSHRSGGWRHTAGGSRFRAGRGHFAFRGCLPGLLAEKRRTAFGYSRADAQPGGVFLLVGTWIWFELHESGIHATVAGVILAGIGFTMALFIAGLALDGELLNHAKIGVMMGSLLSAIAGMAILLLLGRRPPSG